MSRRLFRQAAFTLVPLAFGLAVHAEAPSLDALYPAGACRGATNTITAVGKFGAWPAGAWVSGTGVTVSFETNKGKLIIAVAPDAAAGPRLLRLYNDEGASDPRMLVVSAERELTEAEPNNRLDQAQAITNLPATVNGRLDKNGDVDSFALNLRAGEWLIAEADCYRLLSKVDGVLRLVTTNGLQLAWNHDFTTLDPRLCWQATNDQTVILQFFGFTYPPGSEVALTGGEAAVYRLRLIQTNAAPSICALPTEKEPNNTAADAELLTVPASATGIIDKPNDEDRYRFTAQKDDIIEARIDAASLGSAIDAWLKIEDPGGAQIARSDDSEGSADPRLEWKAPTNGTFVAAVGSVTHRGGPDCCYELRLRKLAPEFQATASGNALTITIGATNDLKVDLKRLRGFTNELRIEVEGLPEGVTALTTNFAAKDSGSIPVRFAAAETAKKFSGPIQINLVDSVAGERRAVPFELITRGETGFSHLLVEASEDLWLTVQPRPPEKPKPAPTSK